MKLSDVDWAHWTPRWRATLLFIRRGDELLMIHKKRGLGAGKFNAPGGRLEPGETPLQAAIRETIEELRIEPVGVKPRGELRFQFTDGLSIHGYVFTAADYRGEPTETDEARPVWFHVREIPYDNMWADDRVWLPALLAGHCFEGRFIFDGERMLEHEFNLRAAESFRESSCAWFAATPSTTRPAFPPRAAFRAPHPR